jgi:hypothetical protein
VKDLEFRPRVGRFLTIWRSAVTNKWQIVSNCRFPYRYDVEERVSHSCGEISFPCRASYTSLKEAENHIERELLEEYSSLYGKEFALMEG